jgi:LysR family transcriptional regulator, hydrogen peroxide-inducible genes activator
VEIHQLRYFRAVAATGSFTRAAEQQHVAQPALSQQIMKLEAELGAKLFDRFPRFVRLTRFGEAFLPKAGSILDQIGDARREIQEMACDELGSEVGEVSIGAIPTIAPYLLPPVLSRFSRQHPGIKVNVVEEITSVLLDRLRDGALDMALAALPVPGPDLASEELLREPLYLVVPARHRLASSGIRASRGIEDLREIESEPFLLLKEGHCFRENTLQACRRSRMHPNVVFESGQFSTILGMVSAGMGVSVVPAMAVEKYQGCKFIRIKDERSQRRVGVLRLKRRLPTRAQRALLEILRAIP